MNTYTAHFKGDYSHLQRTFTAKNVEKANSEALEKAYYLSKEHGDNYRVVKIEDISNKEQ